MTDPHDLDDLASAHLDGTTTAEEAARVAADPQLMARVEALRAVRAALRAPVPAAPDHARDDAVDAALAAFDEEGRATAARDGASVTPLAARRGPAPTTLRVLGAAAVLALLALVVPLLGRAGDDDNDTAASFEETGDAIGGDDALEGAARDAGAGGGGSSDATSTTLPVVPGARLGTYTSVEELLAAVGGATSFSQLDEPDGAQAAPEAAFDGSDCAVPEGAASEVAHAVVDTRVVLVLLLRREGASTKVTVLDAATCAVLAERSG